jgi:hypothetical protein
MDPDFLDRKRRYAQQIFNAINDHPEQFAEMPRSSTAADWRKWKQKAGSPRQHNKVPHHAASGAELQWHTVAPQFSDGNHTLVRLTPEDQDSYKHDPRFQNFDEFGRRYATLGAGPTPVSGAPFGVADLASFPNQQNDMAPHSDGIPIDRPSHMSADDYVNLLLKLDRAYADDLPYGIYPAADFVEEGPFGPVHFGPSYNSNGYTSGLLSASGVRPPRLPVEVPGYELPVPLRSFGR